MSLTPQANGTVNDIGFVYTSDDSNINTGYCGYVGDPSSTALSCMLATPTGASPAAASPMVVPE